MQISGHFLNGFPENAWNPQIWSVSLSQNSTKIKKSPDRNQNLICSEGGHDTAVYHISGNSLHAFSRKCPETPNWTRFAKSKYHTMDMLWEKFQWILPLYMKPISFQSKASVVCSVTATVFIDFCLKKLNVFSQHIGKQEACRPI